MRDWLLDAHWIAGSVQVRRCRDAINAGCSSLCYVDLFEKQTSLLPCVAISGDSVGTGSVVTLVTLWHGQPGSSGWLRAFWPRPQQGGTASFGDALRHVLDRTARLNVPTARWVLRLRQTANRSRCQGICRCRCFLVCLPARADCANNTRIGSAWPGCRIKALMAARWLCRPSADLSTRGGDPGHAASHGVAQSTRFYKDDRCPSGSRDLHRPPRIEQTIMYSREGGANGFYERGHLVADLGLSDGSFCQGSKDGVAIAGSPSLKTMPGKLSIQPAVGGTESNRQAQKHPGQCDAMRCWPSAAAAAACM
ncbi:hypothetical protein LX36DRAFT_134528 [Colletotrichum falcatum]|nr:hypothetical protein LX36DRAFT_134528 [Colletotrichum falcatum]